MGEYINTINLDDEAGRRAALNAINNSVPLKDYMDTELKICDVILEDGVRKGRNGMPDTQCTNVYLISTDNVSYFSQSDGVAKAMRAIVKVYKQNLRSSADGYLPLMCKSTPLPNGNTMKTIVFAD